MNKLLHERLREGGLYNYITDEDCSVTACSKYEQFVANKIADEIEKYYIPRPRFEDGEPVQVGDAFVQKIFDEETVLQKIGIDLYSKLGNMVWFPDEVVQRPELKVLDSDGIEIKVGDTVWIVKTGVKGTVKNVGGNRADIEWDDGRWSGDINAKNLTHEKPVFASDGERIKVGDTVWDIDSGEKLTVVEFANREHSIIQCSHEDDGYCDDFDAYKLTHREPDSLEQLRDDLRDLVPFMPADEFMVNASDLISITNRLTAIMERDA